MENHQVIVEIPGGEHKSNSSNKYWEIEANDPLTPATNIEVVQLDQDKGLRSRKKMSSCTDSSGIDLPKSNLTPTPQQVDVVQSQYPTPQPRFTESEIPSTWKIQNDEVTTSISPKLTPLIAPPIVDDDDHVDNDDNDADDDFRRVTKVKLTEKLSKKKKLPFSIKYCILILSITIVLILSKTIDKLEDKEIWIFELWEWCVLILAILCGRFFSSWCTNAITLLIENNFLLRKKVIINYIQSLRKGVGDFIWFGLILLTWELLINRGVNKSRGTSKVVKYITRGIASTLVVAGLWILKTLLVKIIDSSIYFSRYFYRIQEDIFHYYILQTLSGPSLTGGSESVSGSKLPSQNSSSFSSTTEEGEQKEEGVTDVLELPKVDLNISALTMRELIKVLRRCDFPDPSDENIVYAIFTNVVKPGHKYITEDDLLRFMSKYEVEDVLARIGGDRETRSITKKSFSNWVVNVSENHKGLVHSINDTKSAIKELNKFVTGITLLVLIIIWLIIMKMATAEVLLFISSQFLLAIFTFGASAKSTFEAIIFVFVKYPFDVGDRCVVDGVQVVVEEVNILTTVFLRYDNEKIYYPNSELASKSISNFNRSPDMSDSVDFDLDVSTSNEIISVLKAKIKGYIDRKPQFWRPKHIVRVKGIQDEKKMKMSLYVTHTINFQNYEKRNIRMSKLVAELKKFFEELGIKYYFLSPRSLHDGTLAVENI